MIQLTLTLKMTTAQVVETSVTVNNNSPIQEYVHPDDQTQPTFEILTLLDDEEVVTVFGDVTSTSVKFISSSAIQIKSDIWSASEY